MGIGTWFRERNQAREAVSALENHEVLGPLLQVLRDALGDKLNYRSIAYFSDEEKSELIFDILDDIEENLISDNHIVTLRERLAYLAYGTAALEVVLIKQPTGNRFVSGELYNNIQQLAKSHKILSELFSETNASDDRDSLLNTALVNFERNHLWMNAFAGCLKLLGNRLEADKDWYPSLYEACRVLNEDDCRELLNLPRVIDPDPVRNGLKREIFMLWFQLAQTESKAIRLTWENAWKESFNDDPWM
jgi:hypothetical protein